MRLPYRFRKKEGIPSGIPHFGGLRYLIDGFFENMYIKTCILPKKCLNNNPRDEKVIVSLTSYPKRMNECYFAIKSLMIQDYKPDKIILWLSKNQFSNFVFSQKFNRLISRGLTVKFVDDDLKSHKKYFYSLQEQKENEVVITFDDDIIYEKDAIKKLMIDHKKYPKCVIVNRGFEITFNDGKINEYPKWKLNTNIGFYKPSLRVLPSTGTGCLYPYGILSEEMFDVGMIKKYAFTADDIWVRFNMVRNRVFVKKTKKTIATLVNVHGSQKESLTSINNGKSENQIAICNIIKLFPDIEKILAKDFDYENTAN